MTLQKRSITVMGYALSVLYGTALIALLVYPGCLGAGSSVFHRVVLVILFAALFACSLLIFLFKEWGRKLFVIINSVLGLYLAGFWLATGDQDLVSLILFVLIAVLYFNQEKVRVLFPPTATAARKSVLLVDDDEGVLKAVKGLLLNNGYSVLTAMSGEKGLQIARLQRPDLIILDVILPGIKGRDVCGQLKQDQETRDIPVIFLTAKHSPDDIAAERAVGGIAHLTKPVNARALLREVRKAVG